MMSMHCLLKQLQLVYSLAPIWSALIAQTIDLPGEDMGPLSWAGAAAVLAASTLAAQSSDQDTNKP